MEEENSGEKMLFGVDDEVRSSSSTEMSSASRHKKKKKQRKKCRNCPKCLRRKEKRLRKVAKEVRRQLRLEREHELIESFSHCNFSIVSRESFVSMSNAERQQIQR